MTDFILSLVFLALAAAMVVIQKTYFYLPPRELKRQAARHEPLAEVLWQAVAYGAALRLLLWTTTIVCTAVVLVLLSHVVTLVIAIIAVALLLGYTFVWLPNTRLTSIGGRLTVWLTPAIVWLLGHSIRLFGWLQKLAWHYVVHGHTGLFEREDLVQLLDEQKKQPDNRISQEDLAMAQSVLVFGTKVVRDVLTPRRVVKAVAEDASIGPVVMDELHQSGFSRFPVYSGNKENIVGVLYMHDLVRAKGSGAVSKYMHDQVCYVHEDQPLGEALDAMLKTHQQLFVVVNSFEEYVGIITIEDILEEIIGMQIVDEFDQYEDLRAVAARMAAHDHQQHEKEQVAAEKATASDAKAASKPTKSKTTK